VSLTATADSGLIFTEWSGDLSGSTNPETIVMDGNKVVTATFSEYASVPLDIDGAVSSGKADGTNTANVAHTTGTSVDRLMLVGISWNSGSNEREITSVNFSYGTPTTILTLNEVIDEQADSQPRNAAIYSLLNPPVGEAGTVTVTFSGSVSNGIVVGVANFAGVDQATPLGTPDGATASNSAAPSVTLSGLSGNEFVFDNVFQGAADVDQTLTLGADQTEQWNDWIGNVRAAGSIEQATGDSVTMSWTAASTSIWVIAAVPINPAIAVPTMPSHTVLLGRPTDESVTVNAIFEQDGQVYFEYGTASGDYSVGQTATIPVTAGDPVEVTISGLNPDTRYYYRAQFDDAGWVAGAEHSFHTQRSKGETFTFTIISDSHLGQTFTGNTPERYEQATLNVAADNPDFHLDLGDAFIISDDLGVGSNQTGNQGQVDAVYQAQRPYFGNFSHSAPVFLAIGNHENEEGWNFDDTPFSRALASLAARKAYFLNPIPDGFYTGNSDSLPDPIGGDSYREDYYAWTWGDVLFVVLDPFHYTMTKPYGSITGAGEDDDETVVEDQWNWTLGQEQFEWFKQTLQNSNARLKLVFSHHVTGGQLDVSGMAGAPGYVRGGGLAAPYFEWGGFNADDTWGFDPEVDPKRPGWGPDPVHQLMMDYGVNAYFHGHDHQFVHEVVDGIVYQLVPSPGMTGSGFDLYAFSPYLVTGGNLPNSGHIRVTVDPAADEATVEYVRSYLSGEGTNGEVSYSYTIAIPPCPGDLDLDDDVDADDLAIIAGNLGNTACSGDGCRGDFNPVDLDIDGTDLKKFIDYRAAGCN
jgi:hypothetical protein